MPRGGKRPGAGRPAKAKVKIGPVLDGEDFLRAIMNSDLCDPAIRVSAARGLLSHQLAVEKFKVQLVAPEPEDD